MVRRKIFLRVFRTSSLPTIYLQAKHGLQGLSLLILLCTPTSSLGTPAVLEKGTSYFFSPFLEFIFETRCSRKLLFSLSCTSTFLFFLHIDVLLFTRRCMGKSRAAALTPGGSGRRKRGPR